MSLRVLADAEAEIEAARQYLNRQSRSLGDRFVDELGQALASIESRPLSHARLETLPDTAPYRRALLATFRYAVIFEMREQEIIVVVVAHTSREPNYWLDR